MRSAKAEGVRLVAAKYSLSVMPLSLPYGKQVVKLILLFGPRQDLRFVRSEVYE